MYEARQNKEKVSRTIFIKKRKTEKKTSAENNKNVHQLQNATITDFKSLSMNLRDGCLEHTFKWQSSTGNLKDLNNYKVREKVTWFPVPTVIDAPAEYQTQGMHNGLAVSEAQYGEGIDLNKLFPTGFTYNNLQLGVPSNPWEVNQVFQIEKNGNWMNIPNSNFIIRRWFTKLANNKIVAHLYKEGDKSQSVAIYL